jgi:hypothetical protein
MVLSKSKREVRYTIEDAKNAEANGDTYLSSGNAYDALGRYEFAHGIYRDEANAREKEKDEKWRTYTSKLEDLAKKEETARAELRRNKPGSRGHFPDSPIGRGKQFHKFIMIVGFLGAIFFLSSNITGFAVSNMTSNSSNIAGVVFLLVGLVGAFFYVRRK